MGKKRIIGDLDVSGVLTVGGSPVGGGGGSITDGDKGDIVVSGTGTSWLFDSGVVSTFTRTLLDDTSQTAWLTTLGLSGITGGVNGQLLGFAGGVEAWQTPAQVNTTLGTITQAGAGEIAGITTKTTPVSGDLLVIEDSAASNSKKKVTVGSLSSVVGVTDGDKGDIVVSGSGASWLFDTGVVTPFAKTFLDDTTQAAAQTTLGITLTTAGSGQIAGVTSKATPTSSDLLLIEDAAATNAKKSITIGSIPGLLTNGDKGDITVASNGASLVIDNLAVTTGKLGDASVTYSKIQNVSATSRVLGRKTAAAGPVEELTGTDIATLSNAITTTGAGEIAGIAVKASPTTSDFIVIEDAAASNAKKRITIGTIPISGGLSDGDKGDITVSGSGTSWVIDPGAVTYAKIQNVSATSRILGRKTAAAGVVEELTGPDVATITSAITTVGTGELAALTTKVTPTTNDILVIEDAAASNAKKKITIGTLPITGGVTDGDKGDITVSVSGTVWTIDPAAVTYAKIQNVSATSRVLGRVTAGAGPVEELTGAQLATLTGLVGVTDGDKGDITVSGTGATWNIDTGAVTYAKMQNVSATNRIHGRITTGAGVVEELTGAQAGTIIGAITSTGTGEIAALTTKATPVSGDFLIIEDSAATNAKKKVTIGSLPATGAVSDGDKGDIVVSGSGTSWLFDSTVVSTFSKTLLDDTTQAAWLTTLGLSTLAAGANGQILGFTGGAESWRTAAQARTDLALETVSFRYDINNPTTQTEVVIRENLRIGTITSIIAYTDVGSFTLAVAIANKTSSTSWTLTGSANITGLSAVAVTTTPTQTNATALNVMGKSGTTGRQLTVTCSAASGTPTLGTIEFLYTVS